MTDYRPRARARSRRSRLRKQDKTNLKHLFLISRITKYIFFGIIGLVILIPILFLWYSRDLPTPGKLIQSKYNDATRIYDRKGVLLYSVFQDENRTYVPLNQIAPDLEHATVSVEDENFYKNSGFDPLFPFRIAWNLLRYHRVIGGSGITQQLVKNSVLNDASRTPTRKLKELIISIQMDKRFSKDQILELYLNNIPYGGTAVGIEAAAEQYFGEKAKDLTLAQSVFLSGLPQSPSYYSPFSGHKYYIARSQSVVNQMVKNHYISKDQGASIMAQIDGFSFTQHAGNIKAAHFVMYIKQLLADQFGEQAVEAGGLQVTTTLDYDIQKHAEDDIKTEIQKLKGYQVGNGAIMVTNPKTGEIMSMVGSKDYFDTSIDGNYNDAIANRQPGSSLKPVIYAEAFKKGYTPATMLMDVPTNFTTGTNGDPDYTPVNYDGKFHGPIQIRFALGNSMNIPAVKTLALVGVKDAMQQAYDMGIRNWQPTDANMRTVGLSLVLGGRETSLYDEMTAYGVLANQGVRQNLYSIQKVTDRTGKTLYEHKDTSGQKVLGDDIAFLISHILLDNNARVAEFGPYSSLVVRGKTVSVKTGTTDNKKDNWTVGYTPSFVVGVWVGNNNGTPMNPALASGITGAAPIWNDVMSYVLKGKTDEQPYKPSNIIALNVDSIVGGLPWGSQPTRSEFFIKGTEPTTTSPDYGSKDGKNYFIFKETDPVSKDGKNRWQDGIDAWIQTNHKGEEMYNPPDELKNPKHDGSQTPTPTPSPTPTP